MPTCRMLIKLQMEMPNKLLPGKPVHLSCSLVIEFLLETLPNSLPQESSVHIGKARFMLLLDISLMSPVYQVRPPNKRHFFSHCIGIYSSIVTICQFPLKLRFQRQKLFHPMHNRYLHQHLPESRTVLLRTRSQVIH